MGRWQQQAVCREVEKGVCVWGRAKLWVEACYVGPFEGEREFSSLGPIALQTHSKQTV